MFWCFVTAESLYLFLAHIEAIMSFLAGLAADRGTICKAYSVRPTFTILHCLAGRAESFKETI